MTKQALEMALTNALSRNSGGPAAISADIANAIQIYLQPLLTSFLTPGCFGSPMGPCFPGGIIAPTSTMLGVSPQPPSELQTSNPDEMKARIIREVFELLSENYDITLKPGKSQPTGR
jgi:hypothetical protein